MRLSRQRRRVLVAALWVGLPVCCLAQDSSSGPTLHRAQAAPAGGTISVESKLVSIPAVVWDDKGKLDVSLKKEDFALAVDGKPQSIRYFDLDTDLPLTLGLLVDISGSLRSQIDEERTASSTFLDKMLTSKDDRAFVIHFAHSVELLQDLTNSRPKLQEALQQLDSQPQNEGGGTGSDSDDSNDRQRGGRMSFHGGTTLYDAVFLAADEVIAKQKGRKALVLLTDGVDRGSKESLASAIEAAQRSDSIVYAIYIKGEQAGGGGFGGPGGGGRRGGGFPGGGGGYPGGGRRGGGGGGEQQVDGKKILERMTQETGGHLFEVSKKDTFASIFDEIGQELRSQYRIGYVPDEETASAGYHKIELSFTNKDKKKFTIQCRDGYYTGSR